MALTLIIILQTNDFWSTIAINFSDAKNFNWDFEMIYLIYKKIGF